MCIQNQESVAVAYTEKMWLKARLIIIGASEVGTILGENPWESQYELFAKKTGLLEENVITLPMKLGHYMEPFIADEFTAQTGLKLDDPGAFTMFYDPENEHIACTPDRIVRDTRIPVEMKAVNAFKSADWDEEGKAPLMYQAQLQYQMHILGADEGYLAALVGNTDIHFQLHERNQPFIDMMLKKVNEFWELVQSNTAPPMDGSDSSINTWKILHPKDNGETIELTDSYDVFAMRYEQSKLDVKEAEERKKEAHAQLLEGIGDNTFGNTEHYSYSLKTTTRKGGITLDSKFEDELNAANIPCKVKQPTTYRTLRSVKRKGQ